MSYMINGFKIHSTDLNEVKHILSLFDKELVKKRKKDSYKAFYKMILLHILFTKIENDKKGFLSELSIFDLDEIFNFSETDLIKFESLDYIKEVINREIEHRSDYNPFVFFSEKLDFTLVNSIYFDIINKMDFNGIKVEDYWFSTSSGESAHFESADDKEFNDEDEREAFYEIQYNKSNKIQEDWEIATKKHFYINEEAFQVNNMDCDLPVDLKIENETIFDLLNFFSPMELYQMFVFNLVNKDMDNDDTDYSKCEYREINRILYDKRKNYHNIVTNEPDKFKLKIYEYFKNELNKKVNNFYQ